LAEHHGVRAAGPGQLEPGGDQAVPDRAPRTAPPLRLPCLPGGSAGHHDGRITKWTASTRLVKVDGVHQLTGGTHDHERDGWTAEAGAGEGSGLVRRRAPDPI